MDRPAPWLSRVEAIRSEAAVNADAEARATKQGEEIKDLLREVKMRVSGHDLEPIGFTSSWILILSPSISQDQNLQESGVKIEMLERRMESMRKQVETVTELEGELLKSTATEKALHESMDQLQKELDSLESENSRLRHSVPAGSQLLQKSSMMFDQPVVASGSGFTDGAGGVGDGNASDEVSSYLASHAFEVSSAHTLVSSPDIRPQISHPLLACRERSPQSSRPLGRDQRPPTPPLPHPGASSPCPGSHHPRIPHFLLR